MNDITYLPIPPAEETIPCVLPSPFLDTPHPLAAQAAGLLQQRLTNEDSWPRDFFAADSGKMFGVLVVRDSENRIGFLSGFSGMMSGQWQWPGFVPPIFDQTEQARFLPNGRETLAKLTEQLQVLENAKQRSEFADKVSQMQQQRGQALATLKQQHKAAKAERKQQRQALQLLDNVTDQQTQMAALALASQHHKREATNAKQYWNAKLQHVQQPHQLYEQKIEQLKTARAETSRQLHQKIFAGYMLHNQQHEQMPITHFFTKGTPPAGAGDCVGPKLIHYAQQHQLQPLALAEFWWGASPAAGVRHHEYFYPACRGKCRPILPFMLRGLNVEPEPCYGQGVDPSEPHVVYEDEEILVINKPPGLMSEPGTEVRDSVFYRLRQRYPDCPELRLAHRLDMSTSGLLLVAKNLPAYRLLQQQFIKRTVEKRYEALLSKPLPAELDNGDIDLPLRVDFDDRPRQLVCYEYGKTAQTHWQVIDVDSITTRVYFYPHTGRTHQLRVHASHRDGLNAPIVGDDMYGQAKDRLMLHAQQLSFDHPTTRERLTFELPAPF